MSLKEKDKEWFADDSFSLEVLEAGLIFISAVGIILMVWLAWWIIPYIFLIIWKVVLATGHHFAEVFS